MTEKVICGYSAEDPIYCEMSSDLTFTGYDCEGEPIYTSKRETAQRVLDATRKVEKFLNSGKSVDELPDELRHEYQWALVDSATVLTSDQFKQEIYKIRQIEKSQANQAMKRQKRFANHQKSLAGASK